MSTVPKTMRFRKEFLEAIRREREAANFTIDDTEAAHRLAARGMLADDGKFGEIRVYIVGGLACRQRLEFFAAQLEHLLTRIQFVESRLAGPLNPETFKDKDRRKNVQIWRKLSEDLPPEIKSMIETATRLARWMNNGTTKDTYLHLAEMRNHVVRWKNEAQSELAKPGCNIQRVTKTLETITNYLTALDVILGTKENPGLYATQQAPPDSH